MLKSNGEIPGRRVLICGNGPLNMQIATELSQAGAEVVAVTELAPSPYTRVAAAIGMFASDPALSLSGLSSLRSLRRSRIRMLFGHGLHSVERNGAGLKAWVGRFDGSSVQRDLKFDVDQRRDSTESQRKIARLENGRGLGQTPPSPVCHRRGGILVAGPAFFRPKFFLIAQDADAQCAMEGKAASSPRCVAGAIS